MRRFIKLIMVMVTAMVAVSFASCSCDEEDDYGSKEVDAREYKSYIIGKWVLSSEDGYADFNQDGLNEVFNADITGGNEVYNSGEYKTCLWFRSFEDVDVVPYNYKRGVYEFNKANKCKYTLNIYKETDGSGSGYIHIRNGKEFDKTYTIVLFKERWLDLKYVDQGQMVKFHFEYVY